MRAWAPHLAKARTLIDTMIDDVPTRRTVAVLGSGPLFELPLESLARTFETVLLVDRAHLRVARRRAGAYANVHCDWRDLAPAGCPNPLDFLAGIPALDWVISANLVSDLARHRTPEDARRIVASHLETLKRLDCPATLITDLDYRVFNRHGVVLDSADLLHGYPVPRSGLRWKWEAAPFGEEHPHTRRVHTIAAWADWRYANAE